MQLIAESGGKVHESEVSKFEQHGQFRSRFTIQDGQWSCPWLQFTEQKKETEKAPKFIPPTEKEVIHFFMEKTSGSVEDAKKFAEKFIAHYEEKQWRPKNRLMRNWKLAAISAWDMDKFVTKKTASNNGTEKISSRITKDGHNAMRDALNGRGSQG